MNHHAKNLGSFLSFVSEYTDTQIHWTDCSICTIKIYHEKIAEHSEQLDDCIVWNAHSTVFGSKLKHSDICAQAVYFLHSTRPSVVGLCTLLSAGF